MRKLPFNHWQQRYLSTSVMTKVSICIPVFRVRKYIEKCLESCVRQTLQDIEIICVDDCGNDGSMEIVKEFSSKDNRVRVISHKQNRGLMQARRTGYMSASGEYITFLDSDDELPLDACEKLYNKAVQDNADVVDGLIEVVDNNGRRKVFNQEALSYGNDSVGVLHSLLAREVSHNLCGKLYSSHLFKNYTYDTYENYTNGEDGILFYQIVKNIHKLVLLNEILYHYNINSESSTNVRLNTGALRSIVMFNKQRLSSVADVPELRNLAIKAVLYDLSYMWSDGYDDIFYGDNRILTEAGMDEIVTIKNCLHFLPADYLVKIALRRLRTCLFKSKMSIRN